MAGEVQRIRDFLALAGLGLGGESALHTRLRLLSDPAAAEPGVIVVPLRTAPGELPVCWLAEPADAGAGPAQAAAAAAPGVRQDVASVDEGHLAYLLAVAKQPAAALELGSGAGSLTVWLAAGLPSAGHLVSVERDSALRNQALRALRRAGLQARVEAIAGDVERVVPRLGASFDLAVVDTDPLDRPAHLALAVRALRQGGLVASLGGDPAALAAGQAFLMTHPRVKARLGLAVGRGVALGVIA